MSIVKQIFVVFGVCLVGGALSALSPLPVPGSILAMLLLLALLGTGLLKEKSVRELGGFLQKHMVFFFIPAGVSLVADLELLRQSLVPFLVIGAASTFVTFGAAAGAVWLVRRLQRKRSEK